MVVVDRPTKYKQFVALTHPKTALTVAQEFLRHIFKLHGLPISIVYDRDKVFTSAFWQELFKSLGTRLNLNTAYHPQTNGQTKRRYLKDKDAMLDLLKESLHKSQERMKFFADHKRSDRSFEVGEQVYLKLQPYMQSSMAIISNFKLSPSFQIGSPSYIQNVSQLKKKLGAAAITAPTLPLNDEEGGIVLIPVASLELLQDYRKGNMVL
ncbi:uncharacterized protein K02A2.6-like [Papaver somniferum]|uniref:uncharacterized protein K02A2.6-like n=1 Tax=Papaver somniferum TaxID=3469 RepID=UPI000E70143E|nr:uncharacterized protein K02A2.6-like [Papaver somniferum]